jgi:N-methylhydantoinase A
MFFLSSDVGGTFVDLVLFDATRGRIFVDKVPSTGESAEGILQGVSEILKAAGVSIADVARFVHGTTIATNAWLTHRGARVLFLVTAGFKDVLEIGTQRRPELYSLTQTRPAALAPRSQAIEVRERLDAFGGVVAPLSQDEVRRVMETIRTAAPQSVAISLLFSYLNDRHEARSRRPFAMRSWTFLSMFHRRSTRRSGNTREPTRLSPPPTLALSSTAMSPRWRRDWLA